MLIGGILSLITVLATLILSFGLHRTGYQLAEHSATFPSVISFSLLHFWIRNNQAFHPSDARAPAAVVIKALWSLCGAEPPWSFNYTWGSSF